MFSRKTLPLLIRFLILSGLSLALIISPPPGHRNLKSPQCIAAIEKCLDKYTNETQIVAPDNLELHQNRPESIHIEVQSKKEKEPVEAEWTVSGSPIAHPPAQPGITASFDLQVSATPWKMEDWSRLRMGTGLKGRIELLAKPTSDSYSLSTKWIFITKVAPGTEPHLMKNGMYLEVPSGGYSEIKKVILPGGWKPEQEKFELVQDSSGNVDSFSLKAKPGADFSTHVIRLDGATDRCLVKPTVEIHVKTENGEVVKKYAKTVFVEIDCPS